MGGRCRSVEIGITRGLLVISLLKYGDWRAQLCGSACPPFQHVLWLDQFALGVGTGFLGRHFDLDFGNRFVGVPRGLSILGFASDLC